VQGGFNNTNQKVNAHSIAVFRDLRTRRSLSDPRRRSIRFRLYEPDVPIAGIRLSD